MSILDWFAKKQDSSITEKSKLDIPGNLWVKCISCNGVLYSKELENNLKVCPHCEHHFRLTHKERLAVTVDENSFNEMDANLAPKNFLNFVDTVDYSDRISKAEKRAGIKDAVITGSARIGGHEIIIAIMDFSYMGGSMGSVVGEKITRAIELATEKNIPIIIMSSSGGARMQEGAMSLMQMAKTSAALKRAKEKGILYVSVLLDPTTGGTTASFAMLGDVHLSEPNALIGFAGPRVIEQTIRQKLPKGFQQSEYLVEHGMVDHICKRSEMKACIIRLLEFAQGKIKQDDPTENSDEGVSENE